MGNHSVGRAMVACATIAAERRKEGETALDILDLAAEQSEIRGMDAEFDDAFMPGEPMYNLVVEAFGGGAFQDDEDGEAFYEGPYSEFRQRYELC